VGLNDAQKLSRKERVAQLNAALGISDDGKSRLPETAANTASPRTR